MRTKQSSPPKLAGNGQITSNHLRTWYLSTVRGDPWLCYDVHIFYFTSASHIPKQHWKALGPGSHPVFLHVEYEKAYLHTPHQSENNKSPSTSQNPAAEHVALAKSKLANQIKEFHSMLFPQTRSHSSRVVNTSASSETNWVHWLSCLHQRLSTIIKHFLQNFVCDLDNMDVAYRRLLWWASLDQKVLVWLSVGHVGRPKYCWDTSLRMHTSGIRCCPKFSHSICPTLCDFCIRSWDYVCSFYPCAWNRLPNVACRVDLWCLTFAILTIVIGLHFLVCCNSPLLCTKCVAKMNRSFFLHYCKCARGPCSNSGETKPCPFAGLRHWTTNQGAIDPMVCSVIWMDTCTRSWSQTRSAGGQRGDSRKRFSCEHFDAWQLAGLSDLEIVRGNNFH